VFRGTCGDYRVLLPMHTGRGCRGHPAFPAPSDFFGRTVLHNSGAARRDNVDARLAPPSCPANGSRECAPDDRLRRGIQHAAATDHFSLAPLAGRGSGWGTLHEFDSRIVPLTRRALRADLSPQAGRGDRRS
jgi:hypothetical protein